MPTMKPILFSTPMVKAILAGNKTMTRRVVKGLPDDQSGCDLGIIKRPDGSLTGYGFEKVPYQPGDILWVRETWNCIRFGNGKTVPFQTEYWYKADESGDNPDNKWRPSIFMPREAARIFLRVKGVRVERVQEISETDAIAEGVTRLFDSMTDQEFQTWSTNVFRHSGVAVGEKVKQPFTNYLWHGHPDIPVKLVDAWPWQYSGYESARDSFSSLWQLINAARGFGWDTNPWVWVVEFERCERPEGWPDGRD